MKLVAYKVISTIYITISVHHLKKETKKTSQIVFYRLASFKLI